MPDVLVILILAVWVGATALLVNVDRADKFLWIPTLLVLAGLFSSMLPLAVAPYLAAAANGFILVLFIISLAVLPKALAAIAITRHIAR